MAGKRNKLQDGGNGRGSDGSRGSGPGSGSDPLTPIDLSATVINIRTGRSTTSPTHGELTKFRKPGSNVEEDAYLRREKTEPYDWDGGYIQFSQEMLEKWRDLNLSKEAERVYKTLLAGMDFGNWIRIKSLRKLGERANVESPMPPQSVFRALKLLEDSDLILRQTGGRRIFVNPRLCYRGGGNKHRESIEDWNLWVGDRKQKKAMAGRAGRAGTGTTGAKGGCQE